MGQSLQVHSQGSDVQAVTCQFQVAMHEDRDQFVESLFEHRISIHIQHLELEGCCFWQGLQRSLHVMAEVAVGPAVQGQVQCSGIMVSHPWMHFRPEG